MVAAKKKTKTDPKRLAQARKNYADHGYLARAEYNQRPEVKKRKAKQAKKNYQRRKKNEPEKMKAEKRKSDFSSNNKLRKEILSEYSQGKNTCRCCRKNCTKAWDLDHIDNTGNAIRKKLPLGTAYYRRLRTQGFPKKNTIHVKCCNCNQARKYGGHKKTDHKRKTYIKPSGRLNQKREFRYKFECFCAYCKFTKKSFLKLFEEMKKKNKGKKGIGYEAWTKTKIGKYVDSVLNNKLRCESCGEKWPGFLTLNHVHGGGSKERKNKDLPVGKSQFSFLRKDCFPDPNKWNVLCYDCQRIDRNKRYTKS